MYTWGYLKDSCLYKLNISETEANTHGFLNAFHIYANEAMTQICSAIKPNDKFFTVEVTNENKETEITMPDDFISFSDDIVAFKANPVCINGVQLNTPKWEEAYDNIMEYSGYNKVILKELGIFKIPYNARWFVFDSSLEDDFVLPVPADILDAIPSYIVSQCYKQIDDQINSTNFRNEFEMFLSRIDNTSFKTNRTFDRGDW